MNMIDVTGRALVVGAKISYAVSSKVGIEVKTATISSLAPTGVIATTEEGKFITIGRPDRITMYDIPLPEVDPDAVVIPKGVLIIDGLLPAWRQAAVKAADHGISQDFMAAPQVVRVLEFLRKALDEK